MLNRLARLYLKLRERVSVAIHTAAAHTQARLGVGTRVYPGGDIINIRGEPDRIVTGINAHLRGELLTFAHAGRIAAGDWLYLGPHSTIWSMSEGGITLGNGVLISMGVAIHDGDSHPLDPAARLLQTKAVLTTGHPRVDPGIRSAPIVIGDDVWIGIGATVLKGVKIGARAIIGAYAVVASDVPEDGYVPGPRSSPEARDT